MDVVVPLVQGRQRPLRMLDVVDEFSDCSRPGALAVQHELQAVVVPPEDQRLEIDLLFARGRERWRSASNPGRCCRRTQTAIEPPCPTIGVKSSAPRPDRRSCWAFAARELARPGRVLHCRSSGRPCSPGYPSPAADHFQRLSRQRHVVLIVPLPMRPGQIAQGRRVAKLVLPDNSRQAAGAPPSSMLTCRPLFDQLRMSFSPGRSWMLTS